EHFVGIADAINTLGGNGLWDEEDGFYYDQLHHHGDAMPLRIRSMVGLLPLIAVEILEDEVTEKLPKFRQRMKWFLENRRDLAHSVTFGDHAHGHTLLAIPSKERLQRVVRYLFDESEFLSRHGLRALSRVHGEKPYVFRHENEEFRVDYVPGEGNTDLF